MMKIQVNRIISYLDELYPNAYCELNYTKGYELLIATMLSAQTTDKRVNMVTEVLFAKYPTITSFKKADIEDIRDVISSIGTFNRKAQYIKDIAFKLGDDGYIPNDRLFLEGLSGVGRKTTNIVLSNLYNEPCIAVDTHVSRVSIRLGIANPKDSPLTIENKLMKVLPLNIICKLHHQLVFFGRYHCKSIKPNCINCKLYDICSYEKKRSRL